MWFVNIFLKINLKCIDFLLYYFNMYICIIIGYLKINELKLYKIVLKYFI